MIILNLILIVIYLHQLLFWIWLWQVKEYRFDRMRVEFDLHSFLDQLNLLKWWRPKVTARGICTLVIGLSGLIWPIWSVLFAPAIAAVTVAIVAPVFIFYKKYLVIKAMTRMKDFKGVVIGITGSFGKSSTKELLRQVIGYRFKVITTEKNVNSEIGVAQTVLNKLKGDEDFFIVEMGAYKIGEIKDICLMVRPKAAILTGIGDQHLALFGSLENIKKAKHELIDSLPKDGFGLVAERDFSVRNVKSIRVFWDRTEFEYKNTKFTVKIMGRALISNVVAAIKMAEHFGMDLPTIQNGLMEFNGLKVQKRGATVIVDNSYNNSKEGFLAAIDYLQAFKDYRKVVVTAGIIELGPKGGLDHQEIGQALVAVDKVYVTSKKYFDELNLSGKAVLSKDIAGELNSKTVVLLQGRTSVKL